MSSAPAALALMNIAPTMTATTINRRVSMFDLHSELAVWRSLRRSLHLLGADSTGIWARTAWRRAGDASPPDSHRDAECSPPPAPCGPHCESALYLGSEYTGAGTAKTNRPPSAP